MTNFLLSIYVARSLGAAQFGAFSLAYVTYGLANNANRGLAIEPLLVRFSGASTRDWRRAAKRCVSTSLLVGVVLGLCAITAGAVIRGTTGLAFVGLGLVFPVLLLQDSWRYVFFSSRRGYHAFINDTIWLVVQVPLMVLLKTAGHANVFWFVLAWGAGAFAGAIAGSLQANVVPNLWTAKQWLVQHRDLGLRFFAENTGGSACITLQSYGISYILGVVAVGSMRAAGVLMGPLAIMFYGIGMITVPEAARILRNSPRYLPLYCLALSAGLASLTVVWTVLLLVGLPHGIGKLLLGTMWLPTYPLVVPTALATVAGALATGAAVGMHALGIARRSLRATLTSAALVLALSLSGAMIAGIAGALYFGAAAAMVGMLISWGQFREALHESDSVRVPRWLLPRSAGKHTNSGTDPRGSKRGDDRRDESRRERENEPLDSWPDGSYPSSPAARPAVGYANGIGYVQDGYSRQAREDIRNPAAGGYEPRGYKPNGNGGAAQGFGWAEPEFGTAAYQEAGYPSMEYHPAGRSRGGYGCGGYDAPRYSDYAQEESGPEAPAYARPTAYADPGSGGRARESVYANPRRSGGDAQPGYGDYGTSSAPDRVNGAPGRSVGRFPDPAGTAQYGRLSSPAGLEFIPADGEPFSNKNGARTGRPYARLTIFTLLEDRAAEFDRLAEWVTEGVRIAEPDTLLYSIHVVPKGPMQRIIYEIYRDRAAFESHEQQPHIQRFIADRRSCVLATNIIDLQPKYAKVAALDTAQVQPMPALRAGMPTGVGPASVNGQYPANGWYPAAGPGGYSTPPNGRGPTCGQYPTSGQYSAAGSGQ